MEYGLVAIWLGLFLVLLYAGATVASAVFPRFADRGAGLGVPVALAVIWLVTYWIGRVSLTAGVWLGVVVLAVVVGIASYRGAVVERSLYAEMGAVFSIAFLLVVAIRALDPAIVPIGGEKFLDYGLLRSLLRAPALPPEDMWFAGEPVAYYYGGHLTAAILTRLTGTAPAYAYNLALAGFYAMLVTGVYGLAGNLAAARDLPHRLGGVLGALFVGIASNLVTPLRFVLWLLPDGPTAWIADVTEIEVVGLAEGPASFHYWDASRVISDTAADFVGFEPSAAFVITEFPFFAWLNGDLHAHMTSTPFLLVAVGVLFAYYLTPADEVRRRRLLLLCGLPPVAGLLAVTNTWSFPTVGGLTVLTLALAPAAPATLFPAGVAGRVTTDDGVRAEAERVLAGVIVAAAVLALGALWSAPFWIEAASGRRIATLPDRSSLGELLVVHAGFLLPFAAYLYARWTDRIDVDAARIGALVVVGAVGVAATADVAALGLFVPLVLVAWLLRRPVERPSLSAWTPARADGRGQEGSPGREGLVGFEAVLVIAGAGLVTIVEFVFVAENVGRMNTVFKTYMQVWVLWSVAVGTALAWIASRWHGSGAGRWRQIVASGLVVVLVLATSLYAGLALVDLATAGGSVAGSDDATLDGLAWIDDRHADEAPAIRWLDEREGRPTIVTAAPAGYRWNPDEGKGASAPASLTGLPTVAGWHHEAQYRSEQVYRDRVRDVGIIYTGDPSDQVERLDRYDVEYVYVGPAERNRYEEITVDRVEAVEPVREWDAVTIYRVDQDGLG